MLKQNISPSCSATFYLAVFLFGFLAILVQIVLLREFLVVAYGNELYLAVIFACWFLGIALGAFIAALFTDKLKSPLLLLTVFLLLQAVLAPVDCFFLRQLRTIFSVTAGEIFPFGKFFLASALILIPFTFLTGINFPLFCRCLAQRTAEVSGRSIGVVYWVESFGSIVAGIGFTFLLVKIFPAFGLLTATAVIVSATIFFLIVSDRFFLPQRFFWSLTLLIVFVLIAGFYISPLSQKIEEKSILLRWESLAPGIQLIDSTDTRYQNLALSMQSGQYNVSADGKFIAFFPEEFSIPPLINLVFTQVSKPPERLLIIGGGNPEIIYFALKYKPKRIDYVELDEALLPLLLPYLRAEVKRALFDRRVFLHFVDARRFIKFIAPRLGQRYDIIWINCPDPATIALNRFYTLEFYHAVSHLLAPQGVMATQVSSAVNYFGDLVLNYLGSVAKTISIVFPKVIATPGERAFLFATPAREDGISTEPAVLIERYQKSQVKFPNFSPYVFYTLLDESQRRLVNQTLRTAFPSLPINSDLRPLSYFYNLALWANLSGIQTKWLFSLAQHLSFYWLLIASSCFLFLRFGYLFWRRPAKEKIIRFNGLFLLSATGFSTMAGEMIILLLYQSVFGYLYQKVGLIVSAFMLGLVVGAFVVTKLLPPTLRKSLSFLIATEFVFLLFLLGLFSLTPMLKEFRPGVLYLNELFFYLITGILGVLGGIEFPLVGHTLLQIRYKSGYSAAIVDSLDHLGAAFGALATGLIIIPALGMAESFLALGLLKFISLLLLILAPKLRNEIT